jgi:two-component system cell cycle sensor histidine kinase/response regulator CckA
MLKDNHKIILAAGLVGLFSWVFDTLLDCLFHPSLPFLICLVHDVSFPEFVERVFMVFSITVLVLLWLRSASIHRKTREALWEGEHLLEGISNSIQEGLIVKDRDFKIIRVNPVVARWYDYAMPLVGRKCYEALKGRLFPCTDCPAVKAMETGAAAHEIVPKPGPGGQETGWLELHAYPLVDPATGEVGGVVEFARDITLERQTEAVLQESETKYRLLVSHIPAVVFKGYLDWSIDFIDDKIEELTGYTKEDFNSRRMKWRDLILPEDLEGAQQVFLQALKTTQSYVREYRIRHKDGRIIWIQARGQILCDLQGKVEYVYGVFFDITEHKEAEAALRRSRASLAEAQSLAHLGNWEWLIQNNEVLWSDEVYRILGLTPGEVAPSFEAYLQAVHPDDQALAKEAVSNALYHDQPYHIMHRVIKPDGAERFIYAQAEVFFDAAGQPVRMVGTVQDITERRLAQAALAESERRYRLLAEHVTDVIWTMDLELKSTFVSPAIKWLTGYEARDYLKLPFERMLTPASQEIARHKLQEELARAEYSGDPARSATLELEMLRQDGSTVWAEIKASILRDDQGRPVGLLGVSRDITARRNLEAQLRQAQKMEVVGRLAGGVAHDFNNLLTAILGYSELMLADLDIRDPAYQNVTEIKKAGERAAMLTRQLLAFSRRQVLQPKPLHLNQVIENLGKMLKRVIGEDIRLEIICAADLGWVLADPGQLEQVILNLTVNARDAMPRGGGLTISTANVELDGDYAEGHAQVQPGHYVQLTVSDSGCGMDAATRDHIFEPFFTTKEVGQGTGLGLSTVYGIVRQSGGHIWVYSEPGQGTTFKIYLPKVAAETESALPGPETAALRSGNETILLVEDDDGVREIAGRILRQSGYQILPARDGHEALQVCQEFQGTIHLVLSDLVMPGLNGHELMLRLASLRPGIKVAFMSGYAADGILDRDLFGTGVAFIQKPFEARALTTKIWELLHAA